ncbi:DUF5811 family protein [Halorarius litoreus]|uniref:DUF5811 family protein n=1 Tax=Halorarius litoreus TaxID=2962676 RepID=UPI0020CC03C2|nr:DUF5811 family protein [Halorarius litoreus]
MRGNAPTGEAVELTPDQRRVLRRDGAAVAARARELLPDEFVVGSELIEHPNGIQATVAVRSPGGGVVSAGFSLGEAEDPDDLAREIAAGAALEAKNTPDRHQPTAR